jgi:hypothetical protein
MDSEVLFLPQGKDVVVTARFPTISDGTGVTSELYYKDSRYTADTDPTTQVYTSQVQDDPDNPGATFAQWTIPADDNIVTGAFWYRVDCIDSLDTRRMAACGTLLVEAV